MPGDDTATDTPTDAAPDAPPVGYRIVLPPGWQRIPLRRGTRQAVRQLLDHTFREVDRDRSAPLRRALESTLWQQIREAQYHDGLDLYLPVAQVHGHTIAASILVSELSATSLAAFPASHLVTALVDEDDAARRVRLDGAHAVRTERVDTPPAPTPAPAPAPETAAAVPELAAPAPESAAAVPDPDPEHAAQALRDLAAQPPASRRVEYTVAVPGTGERWLIVVFSTLGDGDPAGGFADLLVELFDAMMTTFRWVHDTDGSDTDGSSDG